ncbi:hypothetical protein ACIO1C_29790 [Streptomyces sp. NPDC087420]|uniref:hypothetical protein n=1 Tax=Streptomyces sp. NPDC087420 TaxID=3365785 RepID=UPI0038390618
MTYKYKVTLDGAVLAQGGMREVQAASAEAVTGLLAQDPDGVAMSAAQANRDFQDGAVEAALAAAGEYRCPFWVKGVPSTLIVTREG